MGNYWTTNADRYVKQGGSDDEYCYEVNSPCLTIAMALQMYYAGMSYEGYTNRSPKVHLTGTVQSDSKPLSTLTYSGTQINTPTWTINIDTYGSTRATWIWKTSSLANPIFQVSTGSLTLNNFNWQITASLSNSLVYVTDSKGTLSLQSMTISSSTGYTFTNNSPFRIQSGTLTCSQTTFSTFKSRVSFISLTSNPTVTFTSTNTFTYITRTEGTGAAVFDTTSPLTLSGITFTSCSSVGKGGAISLTLSNSQVSLSSLTFTACSASCGAAIYVEGGEYLSASRLIMSGLTFRSDENNNIPTSNYLDLFSIRCGI